MRVNMYDSTHSYVVILAAGCESVCLRRELFLLSWTRLLERHGLEVAGRYWLRVMPADFERSDAHVIVVIDGSYTAQDVQEVVNGRCGGG